MTTAPLRRESNSKQTYVIITVYPRLGGGYCTYSKPQCNRNITQGVECSICNQMKNNLLKINFVMHQYSLKHQYLHLLTIVFL